MSLIALLKPSSLRICRKKGTLVRDELSPRSLLRMDLPSPSFTVQVEDAMSLDMGLSPATEIHILCSHIQIHLLLGSYVETLMKVCKAIICQ